MNRRNFHVTEAGSFTEACEFYAFRPVHTYAGELASER